MGQIAFRVAALNRRERHFLIAGAAALAAFLLYLLLPGSVEPGGELAGEAPRSSVPAFHPPVSPTPTAPSPPPPAAPAASLSGLVLRGVLGGGAAIIGFPDGNQRSVPVGREFLPGVTLKEVALRHVILVTISGESRLEFNKPVSEIAPAAGAVATAKAPEAERHGRETLEFRTGLMPFEEEGRIRGFAIRPGASLPIFQRAGLRPGDVIVSVNGQAFRSEEKVLELAGELASAKAIEIDFVRGGRRMTGKVEPQASIRQ